MAKKIAVFKSNSGDNRARTTLVRTYQSPLTGPNVENPLRSSKYLTSAGFALLLGLMVALMATATSRLNAINKNLKAIVSLHNQKMGLVWEMRHVGRERYILLHRLLTTRDPFVRDELIQQFDEQASRFVTAREGLHAGELTPRERELLARSLKLARQSQAVQNRIVELVTEERLDLAHSLLLREAVPIQKRLYDQLNEVVAHQQQQTRQAEQEAEDAYRSALGFILVIGASFLIVGGVVATYVIRRSARIEADLHGEKELAQVTLHSIGDAVITTDAQGRITFMNPVAEHLTGWYGPKALAAPLQSVLQITAEASGEPLFATFDPLGLGASPGEWHESARLTSQDGRVYSIELAASPIRDPGSRTIGAVLVLHDVSRARELSQQLSWAASHDTLTGLINRTEFERKLGQLLQDARSRKREHALCYLDLDQFKVVNDTCGHMAGDALLRQLAALLEERIRSSDTLARLGGDEFGLLLEGCTLEKAGQVAETLRDVVSGFRFSWDNKPFDVGVSIGVAPIKAASESVNSLLSTVDAACYVAKELGRNRVHIYQPDDQELSRRAGEMQWSQRLSQAIREDRLQLHAQRIVPLQEGDRAPAHAELLVRLIDESGRQVPPMSFIPAAERYGLMPTLDRWVIRSVLERLARLGALPENTLYAINLSGQSLGDPKMLGFILDQLDATGLAPERICFEITETAAVANLRAASRFINTLRGIGCRFALDDFGSGMASFGYLRQLKVDYLKIDGRFVKNMRHDATDRAMVHAINDIGHVMGLRTVAEWVEDEETLALLRGMGIDYAQGYAIHRPEPLAPAAGRLPGAPPSIPAARADGTRRLAP